MAELPHEIEFRRGGNGAALLGEGWSEPEAEFTWAVDRNSELRLQCPPGPAGYRLTLKVGPFGQPQLIALSLNGRGMGRFMVERDVEIPVSFPGTLLNPDGGLMVQIAHPDGQRPSDTRPGDDDRMLSIWLASATLSPLRQAPPLWVQRAEGPEPARLMQNFESLGENCEFGLVQRFCGIEPLGLLRFSRTHLYELLRGLARDFQGADDPAELQLNLVGPPGRREYVVTQASYDLIYHTFVYEGEADPEVLRRTECQKLSLLRRKLLEDLEDAEKIFVVKRNVPLQEAEVVPLWAALRAHGPNTLLYVVPADASHLAGTVQWRGDGLMRGFIDRFAPYEDATKVSLDCWITLCRNAHALWQERRGP